jgi:hypothetical protein
MGRVERRQLIRLGRESGDTHTALRFQAVARLGAGFSTPQVAAALDVATSTVVKLPRSPGQVVRPYATFLFS